MADLKTEVWRGPVVAVMPDGRRFTHETTAIGYDDWRETPFGPMNCGCVYLMSSRLVEVSQHG